MKNKKANTLLVFLTGIFVVIFIGVMVLRGSGYWKSDFDRSANSDFVGETDTKNDSLKTKHLMIFYTNENQDSFELVVENNDVSRRVILRIPENYKSIQKNTNNLNILKKEVMRLTLTPGQKSLGKSHYNLAFYGYPIWGPHHTLSNPEGDYFCMLFSEDVEILDNQIIAKGSATKRPYYGYDDPNL
jgi:hypothetical protein